MPRFKGGALPIAPPDVAVESELAQCNETLKVPSTLGGRLWGLDLTVGLPQVLSTQGVEAVAGDMSRVRRFLTEHFPWLGEEALGACPTARMVDAKRVYFRTTCDVVELRHAGQTVGALLGAPEDWSSYYVRVFAVLPSYQHPGLIRRFVRDHLFEPLMRHQVERVVADTSPSNIAMSRLFSELQFHVTGHQLSDRWGPLVRYTKFLDPACEAAFQRRFAGICVPNPPAIRTGKEEPP